MNIENHIEVNPKILMGKPVIKGTRISVKLLLEKLSAGETEEDILYAHPHLTKEDIKAALAFAAQSCLRVKIFIPLLFVFPSKFTNTWKHRV